MERKAKLCYMGTDSFIVYIQSNGRHIAKYVETRFITSKYELDRQTDQKIKSN